MSKTTHTYWNVFASENKSEWEEVPDSEGRMWQLTLAMDKTNGNFTRLTRFAAGCDTRAAGIKMHTYPEEIFVVSGRLYDVAAGKWLEAGHYASRPPGEPHGPFVCDEECIVLEISYPGHKPIRPYLEYRPGHESGNNHLIKR